MHDDVTMLATFLCPDVTKLQVLATFLLSHVILTVGDGRDMSSSTVPGSADSAPAQNFCPGCEHAWEDRWKRDNSVLADQGYREASQCNYPCKCTNTELRCKAGVNVVKDGCDCCYMCARQQGDLCDYKDKCDDEKGMYCDFRFQGERGICRGREEMSQYMENQVDTHVL